MLTKFYLEILSQNKTWNCSHLDLHERVSIMVESLAPRVNFVESRLTADHMIRAKKSWIEECLKFFISQAPEIDDESLYQQALEQFLLADVAEASNPVIPAPIHLKKEPFTLNGTFVVQLLFLIDICKSNYLIL